MFHSNKLWLVKHDRTEESQHTALKKRTLAYTIGFSELVFF
jgi:hypothetical protein